MILHFSQVGIAKHPLLIADGDILLKILDEENIGEIWRNEKLPFSPKNFHDTYLETLKNFYIQFRNISPAESLSTLLKGIIETPVTLATSDAYDIVCSKKEFRKDEEDETKNTYPVGHYNTKEGIMLRLSTQRPFHKVYGSLVHELGHCVDNILNPEEYRERTATMTEFMAIYVQERFGVRSNYVENTSHHRAQQLLHFLYTTTFNTLSFEEQWHNIKDILYHKKAKEIFQKRFKEL